MANEYTLTLSAAYDDGDTTTSMGVQALQRSVSSKRPLKTVQSIGTSEEAIQLSDAGGGALTLRNLDPTNFVTIKTGTGGVIVSKLLPGRVYHNDQLGSGMLAPFALADTAACLLEIQSVPV